jgi:hypothetical protein
MAQQKPHTHVLWIQKWERGKFREWLPVGKGRIDMELGGVTVAHNFQDRAIIGPWNGYTCLLPIGTTPPNPPPSKEDEDEHDPEPMAGFPKAEGNA